MPLPTPPIPVIWHEKRKNLQSNVRNGQSPHVTVKGELHAHQPVAVGQTRSTKPNGSIVTTGTEGVTTNINVVTHAGYKVAHHRGPMDAGIISVTNADGSIRRVDDNASLSKLDASNIAVHRSLRGVGQGRGRHGRS